MTVCASIKHGQRFKNLLKQPSTPSKSQKIELAQDFLFKYQNIVGRDELRLYVGTTDETSKEKWSIHLVHLCFLYSLFLVEDLITIRNASTIRDYRHPLL
jgi:hypothetical protein